MIEQKRTSPGTAPIRVMLVDDSAVVRGFLSRVFEGEDDIEVVATAANGQSAVNSLSRAKPDIILLDVEMPVMTGLEAIPEILKTQPDAKIVMCSTLTHENAETTIKAMQLGAVDCIGKPSSARDINASSQFRTDLLRMVRHIGGAMRDKRTNEGKGPGLTAAQRQQTTNDRKHQPSRHSAAQTRQQTAKTENGKVAATCRPASELFQGQPEIIAIGSSTGGPQALMRVMKSLGAVQMPIIITQHMPATFTKLLADHLAEASKIPCFEAEDNMPIESGKAYIAKGGHHMLIRSDKGKPCIRLDDGAPINYCKPSVDPMVNSALEIYGRKMLGVILTGMGHDGYESMKTLSEKNGRVIAQDEASSVVWGMPGAVARAGICAEILPLDQIGSRLASLAGAKRVARS